MKTIGKGKEKKTVKGFRTLNAKELLQIRGGEIDGSTQKDIEIH